jgi:hypothetical protein
LTALKPIENRRVRGVASERYPLNKKCAHPECNEDTVDPHHCFPRSEIGNDSWFVQWQIDPETLGPPEIEVGDSRIGWVDGEGRYYSPALPHVAGLCREHHDAVEEHRAWIKLEEGVFVWYDRNSSQSVLPDSRASEWDLVGPLNPQPGSREGKPKRRKFQGEKKRKRKTISVRVPDDAAEDGAGLLDDALTQLEKELGFDPPRPRYNTMMDAANFALMWVRDNPEEGQQ